jgi:hypothetical protein
MHYIKSGITSSLHNSGCCLRSVAPWITVLSQPTVLTKRVIYYKFTFVRYSVKQGTTHRPTSHLVHCVPFLWPREEHTHSSADGLVISLASVSCGDFCWGLLLLFLFFLPKTVFHIASLRTRFPKLESATRISLLTSTSSFIYFFPAIAWYPQSSALFRWRAQLQKHNTSQIWTSTVTAKQI